MYIGLGRFRIWGGGGGTRFRILGGGGGGQGLEYCGGGGGGQIPSRHMTSCALVLPVPSNQIKVTFIIILPFNLVHL